MKFPPQANANFAHDFDRRVFKLKLLEADVDQHAASGLRTGESRLLQKRRQAIAAERADLMAIDLDRFERIYASTIVTQVELNRYQGDRDFAWKVVQFQRKLASLQGEAKFLSPKERDELQSRLDEEREHLVSQNPLMFHKVMSNQAGHRPNQEHYKPRKIVARATPWQTSEPSVSSRVVVGAALEIPQPKTTPWFVKG
ncbi:unnamed protein product [Phytophthora lilii]|uniref:Unnamed protein product n=1 Tax=Phytophthora lilii TaxID=2077276 RepID=A0A9W6U5W3_9STRA|nr:unnamed protein product [Phytophthora lilii]